MCARRRVIVWIKPSLYCDRFKNRNPRMCVLNPKKMMMCVSVYLHLFAYEAHRLGTSRCGTGEPAEKHFAHGLCDPTRTHVDMGSCIFIPVRILHGEENYMF